MNLCLENINYLNLIVAYLDIKEILYLSMCNKILNKNLNPNNNQYINILFYVIIQKNFFDYDKSEFLDKKNLLGKNLIFKINWKKYLDKLLINFIVYKEEKIRKKVKDFFRIHIYLPDLRKENYILEFPNSSIIQMRNYDIIINQIHVYNYYSKYITPEFILNPDEKEGKISILREKLIFEDYLINFKNLFNDFINNEEYIIFINNICDYNFDYLYKYYENLNQEINFFQTNEQNNNIIKFIIWVCHSIKLHTRINCEFIDGLSDIVNKHQILTEYIKKKDELINCSLLINSTFDNINIIVNLLSIYKKIYDDYNKKYFKSQTRNKISLANFFISQNDLEEYKHKIIFEPKFSLYNLFEKIIMNNYTIKLSHLRNKFPVIIRNYFKKEVFNPPEEIKEKNEININNNDNKEKNENDNCIKEKKPIKRLRKNKKDTEKYLVEKYISSELDDSIDGKNVNGIMHTKFNVAQNYITNCENLLIEEFGNEINIAINEKMLLDKIFEIVEKTTRCEGNDKNSYLNKESIIVIRRTKMRLMQKGYSVIFNHLIEEIEKDFENHIRTDNSDGQKYIHLTATEKINTVKLDINLNIFSETRIDNIKNNVNEECDKVIAYLIKKFNINESETYLAKDYIGCSKIEYVFFLKNLLYNYYKQIEIYKERDTKVEEFLKNPKNKYVEEKGCYNSQINSNIELWK